ncbi:MAG: HAD family hydrolase [Betaproteobacteria bacterium]|nr:HAD family hydrolase [Betaproteobacteria bacterium]
MSPRRNYSLLVFDWDGTLFDSAAVIAEGIQHAARDMALPVPDRETARHVIGLGLSDSLRHAMPSLPPERYQEFLALYRRYFLEREDSLQLFAGVPELLVELKERGHQLAVATGKPRRGLDRALTASGIGPLFVASRCGDETHSKPHPAMLLELMTELQLGARDMLMIGDTSHDLGMAASAGVEAVAVTYGAHPEESLRAFAPRACISSVVELRLWLIANG